MGNINASIQQFILYMVALIFSLSVHESAHAWMSNRFGDDLARLQGRISLNPISHVDPIGTLLFPAIAFFTGAPLIGWAKPTPVNPANLRDRRNGEVIVALAGPASNLVMASVGAFLYRLLIGPHLPTDIPEAILYLFVVYNVALAIFNLIPIPPLDGSTLLFRILDPQTAWRLRPILSQYGFIIMIIAIFTVSRPLSEFIGTVTSVLVGV